MDCSEKGWRDCSRFRTGALVVKMSRSVCWVSASARRVKATEASFVSADVSMKLGVDRMHSDTSRWLLFRTASSRCVGALQHQTGEQFSAGVKASTVVGV